MASDHSRYPVNRVVIDARSEEAPTVNSGVSDAQIEAIPGWFAHDDITLFRFFLREQVRHGQRGDLAELGVYLGASAVLIGSFQQPDEIFTVVDLFGRTGADPENDAETRRYYRGLTQVAFEANYRALHGGLPVVIRGPSTDIRGRAASGRHRFVHVDASHEYPNVLDDIETAKDLLTPGGLVVFDDFQSAHFPGVAAAVWPELREGLVPLALSSEKLYATWGDPLEWQAALASWIPGAACTPRSTASPATTSCACGATTAPRASPRSCRPCSCRSRSARAGGSGAESDAGNAEGADRAVVDDLRGHDVARVQHVIPCEDHALARPHALGQLGQHLARHRLRGIHERARDPIDLDVDAPVHRSFAHGRILPVRELL